MSKVWTADPAICLEPKVDAAGAGSYRPITVFEAIENCLAKHGNRLAYALKRKVNGQLPNDWKTWTWNQYVGDCKLFAKALVHLGVQPFKIANIIGFNSPEWIIANTGSIMAGCIAAGIYSTNLPEACKYIVAHSSAEVIVVEDNKQLEKFTSFVCSLNHVKALVMYGEPVNQTIAKACGKPVFSWETFLQLGASVPDAVLEQRQSLIKPGNCCTLIYTSGTTGPPKAVMISHDNVTWCTRVMIEQIPTLNHTERIVSYLPLSHIAAQIVDIHAPIHLGCATYFAQPDALKGSLTVTLKDVRPTFFFGVPRVWEKIHEKMAQLGRETTGIKRHIATFAKAKGAEKSRRAQFGCNGSAPCFYGLANSLVLSKIKDALGLDQTKVCFTGAAPISVEVLNYFASLDIPIYEVFGQSECTGPQTICFPGAWKIGSCGRPMPGTHTRIDSNTKELCYRGRHVMMGYMYMEDKTKEAIDPEGYLHSGDVAEFDDNNDPRVAAPSGFMRITGRIKELIITAGGENIPPVLIEEEMKSGMLALSNVMVVGDRRKFLTMLVSLKCEVNENGEPTDKLAKDALFVGQQIGSNATTMSQAASDPLWKKYIDDGIKKANGKTTSNAQVVQKWKMLPVDFSEKAGDLTPTLKLKRNVVSEKFSALIESMYTENNSSSSNE